MEINHSVSHLDIFFCKMFKSLAHFIVGCLSFCFWFVEVLYIFWILVPFWMCMLQMLSSALWGAFSFVCSIFLIGSILNFNIVQFIRFFSFMAGIFRFLFKFFFPLKVMKMFFCVFFPKLYCFTFHMRSKLIWNCFIMWPEIGIKVHFFPLRDIWLTEHHLLMILYFPLLYFIWCLSVSGISMGFHWSFSTIFNGYIFFIVWKCHNLVNQFPIARHLDCF